MAKKLLLYIHEKTGSIVQVTKAGAKKLLPGYREVEFIANQEGKRVMRIHLEGATVDVSEREPREVTEDVNKVTN